MKEVQIFRERPISTYQQMKSCLLLMVVDLLNFVIERLPISSNAQINTFEAVHQSCPVMPKKKEIYFQLILHIVLFVFFSFDRHEPEIQPYQYVYFIAYAICAGCINYWLLPYYYYRSKYLAFSGAVLLLIACMMILEELVLEPIFFPNTRAGHFPGVVVTLLEIMPVIIILSGFKFAWDAHQKQQEVNELQAAIQEGELQFLRSQIQPHFLFNSLNNLYAYALEQSPKTPDLILQLSDLLRYILYDCNVERIALTKDLAHLKNYIKINELQIEERGRVHFTQVGDFTPYQIAPLILVVFVENAFKHSTSSQSEAIDIKVSIEIVDNQLVFNCSNSFRAKANDTGLTKGIGLQNVKKRLSLLYPNTHTLNVTNNEQEYHVQLKLKLPY